MHTCMPGLAVQNYATYPSMPGALRALCPVRRGVTQGIRPYALCQGALPAAPPVAPQKAFKQPSSTANRATGRSKESFPLRSSRRGNQSHTLVLVVPAPRPKVTKGGRKGASTRAFGGQVPGHRCHGCRSRSNGKQSQLSARPRSTPAANELTAHTAGC
eukprot:COSAG06_NODE_1216_length_10221_cov_9.567477_6_plen_159_part_00